MTRSSSKDFISIISVAPYDVTRCEKVDAIYCFHNIGEKVVKGFM